jgi:hypothetical protein
MLKRTGPAVTILTLAGTLPFMLCAYVSLAPWQVSGVFGITAPDQIITLWKTGLLSLLVYAIAILSFMAGARWGHGLSTAKYTPSAPAMCFAVLPALLAWGAGIYGGLGLILPAPLNGGVNQHLPTALMVLAVGFAVMLIADLAAKYTRGYMTLRIIASLIAIASLSLTAWKAG